jgi:hypothetical protein
MGRQSGEQVEDPLELAGCLRDRELGEPALGAVEPGRSQAEGRAVARERPRDRCRDDEQPLDFVLVDRGVPREPGRRLDIEDDEDLAVARRLEALDDRPPEPRTRPGVEPAKRIARRLLADPGESRWVLAQPAPGPVLAAP